MQRTWQRYCLRLYYRILGPRSGGLGRGEPFFGRSTKQGLSSFQDVCHPLSRRTKGSVRRTLASLLERDSLLKFTKSFFFLTFYSNFFLNGGSHLAVLLFRVSDPWCRGWNGEPLDGRAGGAARTAAHARHGGWPARRAPGAILFFNVITCSTGFLF